MLYEGSCQAHRKERRQLQSQRADILALGFQNSNEENQEQGDFSVGWVVSRLVGWMVCGLVGL